MVWMDGMSFKAFRDSLIKVSDKITAILRPDGIVAVAMELVRMCVVTYPCSILTDEEKMFAIDALALKNISTPKKSDEVSLEFKDDVLFVSVGRLGYKISLSKPEKAPKFPQIDFDAKVSMTPEHFSEAIGLAGKVSKDVVVNIDEDSISFSAESELDRIVISYSKEELFEHNGGTAKAKFSIEYLKDIAKKWSDATLDVELKTDFPIHMIYKFPSDLRVEFYVAPIREGSE